MMLTKYLTLPSTIVMGLLVAIACDVEDTGSNADADSSALALLDRGAEDDDLAVESFADLAAQDQWDDGLEEFLEPHCDEDGCAWAWTDRGGLAGLPDLPEIPHEYDSIQASTTLKAEDPSPAAGTTKRVTITYIVCHETQDIGDDEPYLLLNGDKVWARTGVKNGDSYYVNKSINITSQATVILMEQDVSSNDTIGAFVVSATKAVGEYGTTLKLAGGNYAVYYKVSVP